MDIHPEDETTSTLQNQEAIVKYVEIYNCAAHWRLPII
jgi:hypothetical protein